MTLVFSPVALADLKRLYRFLEQNHPSALKRAAARLKSTFALLQRFPHAGYALDHLYPFRELLVPFGKGHYVIRYRLSEQKINVVHLWHSREDRWSD